MIADLIKLGFSEIEAKVYLACLEINGGQVSIIAKKAHIERVSCYYILEKLIQKGLISQYTKNNVKYFSPEPPQQVLTLAQEKVNIAKSLMPELLSRANIFSFKPKIRFYEGREGIERVFNQSLQAKTEIVGYSNLELMIAFAPNFFQEYMSKKLEKNIKTRYLSPNTVSSVEIIKKYLPKEYDHNLIEILLVNKDHFLFETEILIFDHYTEIVSLHENELLGLIVESPAFARSMKAVFNLAWLGATSFIAQ